MCLLVDTRYIVHASKDCAVWNDLRTHPLDYATDHVACKLLCAAMNTCFGFKIYDKCYFKTDACKSDIFSSSTGPLYLKEIK